jgi:hypothetical protein
MSKHNCKYKNSAEQSQRKRRPEAVPPNAGRCKFSGVPMRDEIGSSLPSVVRYFLFANSINKVISTSFPATRPPSAMTLFHRTP